jgi:hypothetical protein
MKRISDGSSDSLTTFVREAVEKGGVVVSDGLQFYRSLPAHGYRARDASWSAAPRMPRLFFRESIVSRPF